VALRRRAVRPPDFSPARADRRWTPDRADVVRSGGAQRSARDAGRRGVARVPQALINVARDSYDDNTVRALFEKLRLGYGVESADVRLLIRPSGTEPVVRIMIEALNGAFVDEFVTRLRSLSV